MNECAQMDLDPLLRSAVAGDQRALEALIERHHSQLTAFIERKFPDKLRGWLDVSDILQETYASAFRNIRTFDPQGQDAFYRWLATIARTRLIDQLKAAQRFKRRAHQLQPDDQAMSDMLNHVAVYKRTPSQSAVGHELVAAVEKSIDLLPEDYRQVIRLRHDQQLSPVEAAQQMNRSVGAAQMIYSRALKSLREKLQEMALST